MLWKLAAWSRCDVPLHAVQILTPLNTSIQLTYELLVLHKMNIIQVLHSDPLIQQIIHEQLLLLLLLLFLDPGTSFPGCETLSKVWCLEQLQWGLRNCESVRQADCIETLDCRGDPLVQECHFTRVSSAQRCCPANLGDKLVCLVYYYYYKR